MKRFCPTPARRASVALALLAALHFACGRGAESHEVSDAATVEPASEASAPTDDAGDVGDATRGADGGDDAQAMRLDGAPLVLPQVLRVVGDAGTLASPRLVAVTFPGDPQAPQIEAFTKAIGASAYWVAATSEYGVGAATGDAIAETEAAPPAVNEGSRDPEAWLATRFDGTHPAWGTFDPNAVYVVFYPDGTTVTPSVGGCGGAYHDDLPITIGAAAADGGLAANGTLLYAVVSRCATSPDVGRPSGVDLTTFMASHEMVEAVTDPEGTGFLETATAYAPWAYFLGTEVGDMCAFHANAAITPADIGFAVQRVWSNAAAAEGQDPCVPAGAPAENPFFVAAPVAETAIALPDGPSTFETQGFTLHPGSSITIGVGFYGAAAATEAWTVTPFTYAGEHGAAEPYLHFAPLTLAGKRGDVVPLTITRLATNPDGNGADAVKLVSTLGSASNEWYFAVSN